MSTPPVILYDHAYADFANDAEAAVRRETYGEDLGQSSWMTAPEWLGFADKLGVAPGPVDLQRVLGQGRDHHHRCLAMDAVRLPDHPRGASGIAAGRDRSG